MARPPDRKLIMSKSEWNRCGSKMTYHRRAPTTPSGKTQSARSEITSPFIPLCSISRLLSQTPKSIPMTINMPYQCTPMPKRLKAIPSPVYSNIGFSLPIGFLRLSSNFTPDFPLHGDGRPKTTVPGQAGITL